MQSTMRATDVADVRQQHAAELSVLVARMNAAPQDVAPVSEALKRVLEIASFLPGGVHALVWDVMLCDTQQEVLAFCKAYTSTLAAHAAGEEILNPVHDSEGPN